MVVSYEAIRRDLLGASDPAQVSDLALALQHGCRPALAARVRRELDLPPFRGRRMARRGSVEGEFKSRAEPVSGGHLVWTGRCTEGGVPVVTWRGVRTTAARVAFRIATGRDPEGQVRATCSYPHCVAPGHQADRPMRAALAAVPGDEVAV